MFHFLKKGLSLSLVSAICLLQLSFVSFAATPTLTLTWTREAGNVLLPTKVSSSNQSGASQNDSVKGIITGGDCNVRPQMQIDGVGFTNLDTGWTCTGGVWSTGFVPLSSTPPKMYTVDVRYNAASPISTFSWAVTPQFVALPSGLTSKVDENGYLNITSPTLVAYGANGRFFTKTFQAPATCSNAAFSTDPNNAAMGDPVYLAAKSCYYAAPAAPTPPTPPAGTAPVLGTITVPPSYTTGTRIEIPFTSDAANASYVLKIKTIGAGFSGTVGAEFPGTVIDTQNKLLIWTAAQNTTPWSGALQLVATNAYGSTTAEFSINIVPAIAPTLAWKKQDGTLIPSGGGANLSESVQKVVTNATKSCTDNFAIETRVNNGAWAPLGPNILDANLWTCTSGVWTQKTADAISAFAAVGTYTVDIRYVGSQAISQSVWVVSSAPVVPAAPTTAPILSWIRQDGNITVPSGGNASASDFVKGFITGISSCTDIIEMQTDNSGVWGQITSPAWTCANGTWTQTDWAPLSGITPKMYTIDIRYVAHTAITSQSTWGITPALVPVTQTLSRVADEGAKITLPAGTVIYYGEGKRFLTATITANNAAQFYCSNAQFSTDATKLALGDPSYNVGKACYTLATATIADAPTVFYTRQSDGYQFNSFSVGSQSDSVIGTIVTKGSCDIVEVLQPDKTTWLPLNSNEWGCTGGKWIQKAPMQLSQYAPGKQTVNARYQSNLIHSTLFTWTIAPYLSLVKGTITHLAAEKEKFTLTGTGQTTVAYGVPGRFFQKDLAAGTYDCTNLAFSADKTDENLGDPAYGYDMKACYAVTAFDPNAAPTIFWTRQSDNYQFNSWSVGSQSDSVKGTITTKTPCAKVEILQPDKKTWMLLGSEWSCDATTTGGKWVTTAFGPLSQYAPGEYTMDARYENATVSSLFSWTIAPFLETNIGALTKVIDESETAALNLPAGTVVFYGDLASNRFFKTTLTGTTPYHCNNTQFSINKGIPALGDPAYSKTTKACYTVSSATANHAPVFTASNVNYIGTTGQTFTYTCPAGMFTDQDGNTLTYTMSGLPAGMAQVGTSCSFTGTPSIAETKTVTIIANDGNNGTATGTVQITINAANNLGGGITPPTFSTAFSAPAATVGVAYSYSCLGHFTGTNVNTFTYTATGTPAWLTFNNTGTSCSFTGTPAAADVTANPLSITVTAHDGSTTAAGSLSLTVNAVAVSAPTLAATFLPARSVSVPNLFDYSCLPDFTGTNASTVYSQVGAPAWLTFSGGANCRFTGTPAAANITTLPPPSITITASNGAGASTSGTFTLTVNPAGTNNPPIVAVPMPDQPATVGSAFLYTCPVGTFTDPDVTDTLSYSATLVGGAPLPTWLAFPGGIGISNCRFSGTPLIAGPIDVMVTVNDGHAGGIVSDTLRITVAAATPGAGADITPIVTNALIDQTVAASTPFVYQFASNTFTDADVTDTLTYSATLVSGAARPAWLIFTPSSRLFTGTPQNADVGNIEITVTADDNHGGIVTDTFRISVTAAPAGANNPPVFTASTVVPQTATVGQSFTYTCPVGMFTDPDAGTTLTYTISGLPAGITQTGTSCGFAGMPSTASASSPVTIIASDGNGGTVTGTVPVTVNPAAAVVANNSSGSGGGGGGGGTPLPDFSSPYNLICPSSITQVSTLYTPIDFKKAMGQICRPLIQENYYQHHKVAYSSGTQVNFCSSKKPFDQIIYTAKSVALSQSAYLPIPQGKTLVRVVDFSSRSDDDACFSGNTLPLLTLRYSIQSAYDPTKLAVYRYDAVKKVLVLVTATPKVDTTNSEVSFNAEKTGIYAILYGAQAGAQNCFVDMANNPAREDVMELLSQGVITCRETFNPNEGVTRAEITKFALLAFRQMQTTDFPINYPDVSTDQWYYPYIQRASELGIVHGYPDDGSFRPAQIVKRGEALKITVLASQINMLEGFDGFHDISQDDWYYNFANFSYAKNILNFMGMGDFDASQVVTRGELAILLTHIQQVLSSTEHLTLGKITASAASATVPVNTPTYANIQVKTPDGVVIRRAGIPLWCQFSLDQKQWNFFGTLVFTNANGVAQCPIQVTRPATLYIRGYRADLPESGLDTTSITWR